jgi:hypothetical protein
MFMFGVPPLLVAALRRVRGRLSGTRLWRYCAGCGYDQSAVPDVISGRPAAVHVGARPYQRIGIA